MQYGATRLIPLVLAVGGLIVASPFIFGFIADYTGLNRSGVETDLALQVYADSECTQRLDMIDWGTCAPGDIKLQTIYLKHVGTKNSTLALSTDDWVPDNAATFISVSADCASCGAPLTGHTLQPTNVLTVTFALKIAATSPPLDSFTFTIVITSTALSDSPPQLPTVESGILQDDFDDGQIDSTIWEILVSEGEHKEVVERNGRLECTVQGTNAKAGLITTIPYDLEGHYIEIHHVTREAVSCDIAISVQQPSQGETVWWMNDYYIFRTMLDDQDVGVWRCVAGDSTYLGSFSWQGSSGRLRIALKNGVITFIDETRIVYRETYQLPSTSVYINIFASSVSAYEGTNYIEYFTSDIMMDS